MAESRLLFSRIRLPRGPRDPMRRTFTAEDYRADFLIAHADPAYPPEAKAKGIEGIVTLDVLVGKDGIVQTLSVRAGDPLLAESALQTVRNWTYRPVKVNGIPVEVATGVDVSFTLPTN